MPRILQSSLVVFSGGKLEIRKGQDIVIDAFRKLLQYVLMLFLLPPGVMIVLPWRVSLRLPTLKMYQSVGALRKFLNG